MASIIQRNIIQLGQKFLKNNNYKDIDYRGYINAAADPTLESGQVIVNDLKIWIQSSKGDYYRRLNMGGFFDNLQKYPLNATGAASLSAELRSAIGNNFPSITIISLQVTPEYAARVWTIQLVVRDDITGAIAPVTTSVEATT